MMIKEFKDELKKLKSILNDIENLEMTRQLEIKIIDRYIEDHKNGELLSDIDYDKEDILHEILLKEIKPEKLGISEATIDAIKISISA